MPSAGSLSQGRVRSLSQYMFTMSLAIGNDVLKLYLILRVDLILDFSGYHIEIDILNSKPAYCSVFDEIFIHLLVELEYLLHQLCCDLLGWLVRSV